MAQLIELKLVNEAGTPAAWPGTTELVQVNMVEDVEPVWIGVSADGLTNQGYPLTTPIATILGTWPRVYQGIQVVISGQTNLYNNGELDYQRRVAACCISPQSETSPSPSPGESPAGPLMFSFGSTQVEACEGEQTQYYLDPEVDPENLEGATIYVDPELTEPYMPGAEGVLYVVLNGSMYHFNGDTGEVGAFMWPCSENFSMRFDVNLGSPGETVDFRLIFFAPQQIFVDWGDGSPLEEFNNADIEASHLYAAAGEYEVRVNIITPSNMHTVELVNQPLTLFGFHPDVGNGLAMQALQLEGCGLTDAAVEWATFYGANINTIILANNQLTSAIMPQIGEAVLVLNLNGNNLGDVVLNVGPEQLMNLFANNAGVDSFDGSDFVTSSLSDLQLAGNGLAGFDIAELSLSTLTSLNLSANAIPSADVDAILVALDTAGNTDGTVNLSGQTPAAPPGGAGLAAQASLELKNWTVTVDS